MRHPLSHVIFEVTQECNLSCLYCYNHWRRRGYHPRKTDFRSTLKTLKRVLKILNIKHITFTGGEPFLADGFLEMVLMCRMKGKGVTIISNGTSAEESDYNLLSDFKISLFEFPLHSENAVIHDKMAGKEGSFKKVLQSIRYLQRLNTDICVVCVLTKLNIELLRETLVFAESIGIKKFMLARFNIGGRGIEHQEELLPSLQQLKSAFQTANDFSMNSSMQISANVCVPCCIIDQKDYPGIAISHCSSDPMRKPITIDAFGDVRMCNHSPVITGNIFRESIRSIFNSEYVKSWDTTTPLYCRDCVKWEKCRGGCRAASEQLGGSLLAEDPIVGLMKLVDQGADPTPLLSSPSTL